MRRMGKNYVPTRARKRRKRAGLYFRQLNGTISKMEIVEIRILIIKKRR